MIGGRNAEKEDYGHFDASGKFKNKRKDCSKWLIM
jgi:hypothetical protein